MNVGRLEDVDGLSSIRRHGSSCWTCVAFLNSCKSILNMVSEKLVTADEVGASKPAQTIASNTVDM